MLAWVNLTPTNPEVYNAAYTYCFVIFIGMFAQFLYNLLISVLRAIGDSFTPLMFLFISTVLNIVLDVAFIEAFHWGVAGAAVATVLTQFLCAVACFVYIGKRYNGILPRGEDFKVTGEEIWQHVKQGVPLGLQFSILSIGLIVMMSETVKFDLMPDGIMVAGNPAQNGVGAAHKLSNLVGAPLAALGVAMVSFNAQNIGAGRDDRVRKGTLQAVLMGLIASVLTVGVGMLFTIGGFYQYIFLSADKINERSLYFGNTYLYVTYVFVPLLAMVYVLRQLRARYGTVDMDAYRRHRGVDCARAGVHVFAGAVQRRTDKRTGKYVVIHGAVHGRPCGVVAVRGGVAVPVFQVYRAPKEGR